MPEQQEDFGQQDRRGNDEQVVPALGLKKAIDFNSVDDTTYDMMRGKALDDDE